MTEIGDAGSSFPPWIVEGETRVMFAHRFHPTIVEEDLRLPSGRVVQWLRYADKRDGHEDLDGVMGICVRDGEVLIARQYNPGTARVNWEFPGGATQPGEDYETALRRELMEEVGFNPRELSYLGRFVHNNRRSGWSIRPASRRTSSRERFQLTRARSSSGRSWLRPR